MQLIFVTMSYIQGSSLATEEMKRIISLQVLHI